MGELLILVGSVTSAARLSKRLFAHGDRHAHVVGTPAILGGRGCSYSVIASEDSLDFIKKGFRGITIRGIFRKNAAGEYHDIS